jgi:hypothetical protein
VNGLIRAADAAVEANQDKLAKEKSIGNYIYQI